MESNGPYSVESFGKSGYFVKGPFAHEAIISVVDYATATEMALICNLAHAEGRKAERKRFLRIISMTDHEHRLLEREEFLGEIGGKYGK